LGRLVQEGLDVIGLRAKVQCAFKNRRAVAAAVRKLSGRAKVTLDEEPIETIGGWSWPPSRPRF